MFIMVDEDYLLYKIIWHRNDPMNDIVVGYASYIFNHFGWNIAVVFDRYPDDGAEMNTKTAERIRHYSFLQKNEVIFEELAVRKMA